MFSDIRHSEVCASADDGRIRDQELNDCFVLGDTFTMHDGQHLVRCCIRRIRPIQILHNSSHSPPLYGVNVDDIFINHGIDGMTEGETSRLSYLDGWRVWGWCSEESVHDECFDCSETSRVVSRVRAVIWCFPS